MILTSDADCTHRFFPVEGDIASAVSGKERLEQFSARRVVFSNQALHRVFLVY
jgi:hypothetical protein